MTAATNILNQELALRRQMKRKQNKGLFQNILSQPQRMATERDDNLSFAQRAAPVIFGEPEMVVDPNFWKGVAKEATFGLMGFPGDIGYLAGGVAPPVFNALKANWQEGRPLTEGLFENVGDPTDYAFTSDTLAAKAGMPFTNTPNEIRGRVLGGFAPLGAYTGLAENAGALTANALAPRTLSRGPMGRQVGATVYHGSPYKFNAFDMSKVGTGEGAQIKGHGLYFADQYAVGDHYLKELAGKHARFIDADGVGSSGDAVWGKIRQDIVEGVDGVSEVDASNIAGQVTRARLRGDDFNHMRRFVRESDWDAPMKQAWQLALDKGEAYTVQSNASLYEVDLPDDAIANFLDFDAPISEQSETIKNLAAQALAQKSGITPDHPNYQEMVATIRPQLDVPGVTGEDFYWTLAGIDLAGDSAGAELASASLLREGVPGIKYYDQMSRGAGEGTRNYVVFDDQLPTILSRNGEPINPPGSMWDPEAIQSAADQNWKSRDILIEMTPQDFLRMADDFAPDAGKAKRIAEARAAGTQMDSVPVLSFDNVGGGKAKVSGHEGRHRALRAIEEGDETIPVLLSSREGGGAQAIRWGSQDPGTYDYVEDFPTVLEGQGKKTNTIPFPAQRNQHEINQNKPLGAQPIARGQRGAVGLLSGGGDLPMDEASRMQRAQDMGFGEDLYHGTVADIDEFQVSDLGVHLGTQDAANVRLSDKEATRLGVSRYKTRNQDFGEGANVLPVRTLAQNPLRMDDAGEWRDPSSVITQLRTSELMSKNPKLHNRLLDMQEEADELHESYAFGELGSDGWYESPEAAEMLDEIREMIEAEGYDSIKYTNFIESRGKEADSIIVLNPKNIRSKFAKFDPSERNSRNILAGLAPIGIGIGGLGLMSEILYQPESTGLVNGRN